MQTCNITPFPPHCQYLALGILLVKSLYTRGSLPSYRTETRGPLRSPLSVLGSAFMSDLMGEGLQPLTGGLERAKVPLQAY